MFLQFLSKIIGFISQNEKSSNETMLSKTNIWPLTELLFFPVREETLICLETQTLKWYLVLP